MWVIDCIHTAWRGVKTYPFNYKLPRGCEIYAVRYLPNRG